MLDLLCIIFSLHCCTSNVPLCISCILLDSQPRLLKIVTPTCWRFHSFNLEESWERNKRNSCFHFYTKFWVIRNYLYFLCNRDWVSQCGLLCENRGWGRRKGRMRDCIERAMKNWEHLVHIGLQYKEAGKMDRVKPY